MGQLGEAVVMASIGMGVVFAALLALIGIVWVLNHLPSQEEPSLAEEPASPTPAPAAPAASPVVAQGSDRRFRAAAAALAVAMALADVRRQSALAPRAQESGISAWRHQGVPRGAPAGWRGQQWRAMAWKGSRAPSGPASSPGTPGG